MQNCWLDRLIEKKVNLRIWRLSGSGAGLLTSLFTPPYLLMQIPGGILADRLGAKRVLVAMLLLAGAVLVVAALLVLLIPRGRG
jgi:nitrate/nitrite transporter NarK